MNPEFLRQGSAFQDTLNADRVVIGSYDKRSGDALEELYKDFYSTHIPTIIRTALSTAELIKIRKQRHASHKNQFHKHYS